ARPDDLFAWIGRQLGDRAANPVHWRGGPDKVSEAKFHAHLQQVADNFEAVESYPHHPPLPRHHYMHPEIRGGDGKALGWLLARFSPATLVDHDLILSFWLTLIWGGPAGRRPAF